MPQPPSHPRPPVWIAVLCGGLLLSGCTSPLFPDGRNSSELAQLDPDADLPPPTATNAKGTSKEKGQSNRDTTKKAAKPGEQESMPHEPPLLGLPDPAKSPAVLPDGLAGEPESMAIDDVLQYALAHHPVLRQRQHEVEIAQAKLIAAGLLPNPQLTFDTESSLRQAGEVQLTGRLMFTIPTGGKRRIGMQTARAGIQRAQMAVSAESEAVLLAAAETALEVLYLQELAETYGRLSELASQGAEIQKARFQLQAIPFTDKMIAESDAIDVGTKHLDAAAKLESARIRLGRAIGMNPPRPVAMKGKLAVIPIPDVPLETLLAVARQNRPAVAAARAAIAESQWQLALARAEAKPDIEIGPRAQTEIGSWQDSAGGRVQLDLPIFNRNQGGIAESSALVRANRAGLAAAELVTLNDVADAHAELMPLRTRLDYYQKQVLPLAASTEAMILDVYKNRAIEAVQVSELQQKYAKMRLSYLDLRYRYNRVLMRLELFLGQCIGDLPGAGAAPLEIPPPPRLPDAADEPLESSP